MLALYRAGRQAESLEVYRAGREFLVEQLGADPGKDLQELERAILTGDPALDLPSPAQVTAPALLPAQVTPALRPAQLPGGIPDFVGRQDLVRLMLGELESATGTAHVQPRHNAIQMGRA